VATKGRLKEVIFDGHHTGGENHNRLLLLIPRTSLRYISRSSISPQAHVDFIETRFHFI
jgi:hypothetical protein